MELEKLHPKAVETLCMVYLAARRAGVRLERLFVYGSWVRGDWLHTSDLDVILVSRDWASVRPIERPDPIYHVLAGMHPPIWPQLLCYTWDELREAVEALTSVRDASRYWVEVRPDLLETICHGLRDKAQDRT